MACRWSSWRLQQPQQIMCLVLPVLPEKGQTGRSHTQGIPAVLSGYIHDLLPMKSLERLGHLPEVTQQKGRKINCCDSVVQSCAGYRRNVQTPLTCRAMRRKPPTPLFNSSPAMLPGVPNVAVEVGAKEPGAETEMSQGSGHQLASGRRQIEGTSPAAAAAAVSQALRSFSHS